MNELKPAISTGTRFNPIWVVPVVAVLVGIYMVVHTMLTEGPEITIQFNTAEGLEAGNTRLRYRDVDIGLVENVSLSEGMDKVLVTVKMDKAAANMLREDTRFWVVRARVGAGAISGLGTILSGAYIQLDPGTGSPSEHGEYVGLEVPPLTPADAPGMRLTLHSEQAGSLGEGDVIVYRGFKVGRIEGVTFDSEKQLVIYDAFIDAPYDQLVTTNTRFWNASGVSISASASGVEVTTGSMETILLGGVAFANLPGLPAGKKVASGATFKLSPSFNEVQEDPYRFRIYYVAQFDQSLRGLKPGAPVEYRGMQIGRVERILMKELVAQRQAGKGEPIPVLLYLEPARLGLEDSEESVEGMRQSIALGVANGMRASLETGNLITGALYINVDWYADQPAAAISEFEGFPVIPTIPSGLGRLEQQVASLLEKLNALPLEPMLTKATGTMGTMDGTLASLTATLESLKVILEEDSTRALPDELSQILAELRQTLESFSPDSAVGESLGSSVFELNQALRNLEELTRSLSAKPNSLLFPTDSPPDPIPEASPQ
jgi:paraquat-inducible protein B